MREWGTKLSQHGAAAQGVKTSGWQAVQAAEMDRACCSTNEANGQPRRISSTAFEAVRARDASPKRPEA